MKCAFLARVAVSALAAFSHGGDARGDNGARTVSLPAFPQKTGKPEQPRENSVEEVVEIGSSQPERLILAREEVARHSPLHGWKLTNAGDRSPLPGPLATASDPSFPVLYVDGRARSDIGRRIVTGKVVIRLANGTDPAEIAREFVLGDLGSPKYAPAFRIFRLPQPQHALRLLSSLRADPRVLFADLLLARRLQKRSLPNDPLFAHQWYLHGENSTGAVDVDVNVEPLWGVFGGEGTRGQGVRIAVVDDGIEAAHPEFAGRVDTLNDHNWNDGEASEAGPQSSDDRHGTAVAGFAAAAGNNGLGICSVAPEATLLSLRLIAGPVDDQNEAEAFYWGSDSSSIPQIHVKNNSWGPPDEALLLSAPGPLARAALAAATAPDTGGRAGRGTIFVFPAGNGGELLENSNYDGYANDIHVIAVGALNDRGEFASYSEPGANVCVCAPSDGGVGYKKMLTTDRMGSEGFNPSPAPREDVNDFDFTVSFGGTSAAAPLVSGVCALMLQTNPNLGWRDVKEILMRTARKVDETNAGWQVNGAGFHFHHRYGAGLVDAAAACELARRWPSLPLARDIQLVNTAAGPVPDNDPRGIVRTFQVAAVRRVEHVTLKLRLAHPLRGDLRITLTSPAGTTSVLAESHYDPFAQSDYNDWTFSSVQMWGEASNGMWVLRVSDEAVQDIGNFQSASLSLFAAEPGPPPTITSAFEARALVGEFFTHTVTASDERYLVTTQGALPPGLSFDSTTGVLSGTPEQRGLFDITFKVSANNGTATQNFVLRVLSRYEKWLTDYGLPGAVTAVSDPDRDSMTNLAEYASGHNPIVPNSPALGIMERDSATGYPAFRFFRLPNRDDVDYVVEVSADLRNWSQAARSVRGNPSTPQSPRFSVEESASGEGPIDVRVSDQAAVAHAWFRIRFVLAP
ncbi:MAG: S8 family serine peptidase [Verrucomicrobiales bacterium]